MDDNNGDENPYKELMVNNANRVETSQSQMEQWSIFSDVINYVQHSKNPRNFHFVTVKPAKFNKIVKDKDKNAFLLKVNLVKRSSRSKEEYLDR